MGGQAFSPNGLVLDMTGFNAITVNAAARTVTVQAGATWHQIQERLHPVLAIKAIQSTDIFTVGGSISVNAHGYPLLRGISGAPRPSSRSTGWSRPIRSVRGRWLVIVASRQRSTTARTKSGSMSPATFRPIRLLC